MFSVINHGVRKDQQQQNEQWLLGWASKGKQKNEKEREGAETQEGIWERGGKRRFGGWGKLTC